MAKPTPEDEKKYYREKAELIKTLEQKLAEGWLLESTVKNDDRLDTFAIQLRLTAVTALSALLIILKTSVQSTNSLLYVAAFMAFCALAYALYKSLELNNIDESITPQNFAIEEEYKKFVIKNNERIDGRKESVSQIKKCLYFGLFFLVVTYFLADFNNDAAKPTHHEHNYVSHKELDSAKNELLDLISNNLKDIGFIAGHSVRIRDNPEISDNIQTVLARGDIVKVLSKDDGWSEVRVLSGNETFAEGWVKNDYLFIFH